MVHAICAASHVVTRSRTLGVTFSSSSSFSLAHTRCTQTHTHTHNLASNYAVTNAHTEHEPSLPFALEETISYWQPVRFGCQCFPHGNHPELIIS